MVERRRGSSAENVDHPWHLAAWYKRERNRHQGHWDKLRNKMKTRVPAAFNWKWKTYDDLWCSFVHFLGRPTLAVHAIPTIPVACSSPLEGGPNAVVVFQTVVETQSSTFQWLPPALHSCRVGEIKNMPNSLPVQWRLEMICQSARRSL